MIVKVLAREIGQKKGIQIEKEKEKQSLLQMTLYYIEKALKTLPKKKLLELIDG